MSRGGTASVRGQILRFVGAVHTAAPRELVAMLLLTVAGSLTEGVGVVLLVPLLSLAGVELGEGALGSIGSGVSDSLAFLGVETTLPAILIVFVLLMAGRALLRYAEGMAGTRLTERFIRYLRQRLYAAVARSEWRLFSRRRAADVTHAMVEEMARAGAGIHNLMRLSTQAAVAAVFLVLSLAISPVVTVVAGTCGVVLVLLLRRWNARARASGDAVSATHNVMFATLDEHLASLKLAKAYGAEDGNIDHFARVLGDISGAVNVTVRNHQIYGALFSVGSSATLALLVYVAIEVLGVSGATLLVVLFLFSRIVPRFATVQSSYQSFLNVLPGFIRAMDLIGSCEAEGEPKGSAVSIPPLEKGIRFLKVGFSYDGTRTLEPIQELDIWVPARQLTAVVGPSGAGKSTFADLMIGLLVPTRGTILVDDEVLGPDRLRAWRSQIGYVPQDAFLFHDTIRANLLWARPDATEAMLWDALRAAAAAEFVGRAPRGLDTVVGDRGVLLSGGERQRLALARALLREPRVLVLDEATSALDAPNEEVIRAALARLRGQITIVLISHRLTSVRDADQIYVLEDGRVVEKGTWRELLDREDGRFRELCRAQGLLGAAVTSAS